MDCAPVISPAAAAPAGRQGSSSRGDRAAAGFDNLLGSLSEDRTAAADTPPAQTAASRARAGGRPDQRPPSAGGAIESAVPAASPAKAGAQGNDPASSPEPASASEGDDTGAAATVEAPVAAWLPVDLMLSVPASGIRLPDPGSAEGPGVATPGASETTGSAPATPLVAFPSGPPGNDLPEAVSADSGAPSTGAGMEAKAAASAWALPGVTGAAKDPLVEASTDPDGEALQAAGRTPSGIDGVTRPPLAEELGATAGTLTPMPEQPAPAADGRRAASRHPGTAEDVARRLVVAALTTGGPAGVSAGFSSSDGRATAATGSLTSGDFTTETVSGTESPVVTAGGTRLPEIKAHAAVAAGEGADAASELARRFGIELSGAGQEQRSGGDRTPPRGDWAGTTAVLARASQPKPATAAAQPLAAVFADPGLLQGTPTVTPSGPASPTPAAGDVEMARQVVRAISLAWRDEVGEARLHLTPEHLGEVTVSLRVERGVVSAVLQADTAAARDWIRQHESELRAGLEGQGLQLDSLVVTDEGGRRDRQEPQPRSRRPVPRRPGNGPTFEVNV